MPKSILRRLTKRIVVLVNVLAALFFLLGSYGYLLNPAYFWPTGLLTLTAFYFLLILIGFIFFWLFVKPPLALISFITILVCYAPIDNVIPVRFSHNFEQVKKTDLLRVMSWNVAQFNVMSDKEKPAIKKQMVAVINEYSPDIACFQEMVAEDSMVREHGHVDEFMNNLQFKSYFYSYNSKEDFWGYAHFGLIIFSKYPIINRKTVSWYPRDYNSRFQYADIVKGTDTVRVFNIHLQSLRFSRQNLKYIDKPSVEDEKAIEESKNIIQKFKTGFIKRKIQSERIRAEIDKSPYPVIICGDFNDVPNSYAYKTIGKNLQNAFVEKGGGLGRTFSGISPVLRIDNIFTDKKLQVSQFITIRKKLSDHFPIIADLKINEK